jgi:hypothetical protein
MSIRRSTPARRRSPVVCRAGAERLEPRQLLTAVLTTLATFTDGPAPVLAHVAVDANGDLFGANYATNSSGQIYAFGGYVWELPKVNGVFAAKPTTIATFPSDGSLGNVSEVTRDLVIDPSGNLFGLNVTDDVSVPNGLILWEVPKTSASGYGAAQIDHNFGSGFTGAAGQLTVDASGDLFGLAMGGGSYQVFEYSAGGSFSDLYDTTSPLDEAGVLGQPTSNLVLDSAGNLYGVARDGGSMSTTDEIGAQTYNGDVFELPAPGYGSLNIVASFPDVDAGPFGQIAISGNVIYGTSQSDAWQVPANGAAATTVSDIGSFVQYGNYSYFATAVGADGNLYGTTEGTNTNDGTIWEATANGGGSFAAPQNVITFTGQTPGSGLTPDATNLYGDTGGTIFGIGPATIATTPTSTPTPTSTSAITPAAGKSTVPTSIVAGAKPKGSMTVDLAITNGSTSTLKVTDSVLVYATATGTIDANSVLVGSTRKGFSVRPGHPTPIAVSAKTYPATAGTYTLIPELLGAAGTVLAVGTTGPTLVVNPVAVTLSAAVVSASPATLVPGKTLSVTLTLTNTGNTDAKGPLSITLGLSTDGGATVAVPLTPTGKGPTVKANGKPVKVTVKIKTAATVPAGSYVVTALVASGSHTASAVGTTAVTVS